MNFWSIFKRRKEIRTFDEQIKKPIFGSEEERRERFLIIMERLDKKRVEFNVSNEEFNKRLEETKNFFERKGLVFHLTFLDCIESILNNGLMPLSQLFSKHPRNKLIASPEVYFNKKLGLDNYIFLTLNPLRFIGDFILGIDISVIKRPNTIVTLEDIFEIIKYETYATQWEIDMLSPDKIEKCVERYKYLAFNGDDFYEILYNIIALLYSNSPEEYYLNIQLRLEIKKLLREILNLPDNYPIHPEIKTLLPITPEFIKGIVVFTEKDRKFLIEKGMSSDKVIISPIGRYSGYFSEEKETDIFKLFLDIMG
jgi:hypothetical protein